jgi:hypothetical protein
VRRRHVCVTADQRGRTAAGSLCGEDSPERSACDIAQHTRDVEFVCGVVVVCVFGCAMRPGWVVSATHPARDCCSLDLALCAVLGWRGVVRTALVLMPAAACCPANTWTHRCAMSLLPLTSLSRPARPYSCVSLVMLQPEGGEGGDRAQRPHGWQEGAYCKDL